MPLRKVMMQVEVVDAEAYMYDGECIAKAEEMRKPGLVDIIPMEVHPPPTPFHVHACMHSTVSSGRPAHVREQASPLVPCRSISLSALRRQHPQGPPAANKAKVDSCWQAGTPRR